MLELAQALQRRRMRDGELIEPLNLLNEWMAMPLRSSCITQPHTIQALADIISHILFQKANLFSELLASCASF